VFSAGIFWYFVYLSNLSFGVIVCNMEWSLDPGFGSFYSYTLSGSKSNVASLWRTYC